jgi:hypothetical protein
MVGGDLKNVNTQSLKQQRMDAYVFFTE